MLKKILLSALLVLGVVFSAAAAETLFRWSKFTEGKDGKNLSGWYVYGGWGKLRQGCGIEANEKPADYEGNSYRFTGDQLLMRNTPQVTAGKTYRISYKVKTDGMPKGAQVRCQIIWNDGKGFMMKDYQKKPGAKVQKVWDMKYQYHTGKMPWTEFFFDVVAPEKVKFGVIRIGRTGAAGGNAYMTDIKMIRRSEADLKNLIRNPKFLELVPTYGGTDPKLLPAPYASYVSLSKLPKGCGVDFKEKPAGYDGNSYHITGNVLLHQRTMPVTPGKTYRFSCKMKTKDMPWKAQARFQIIWLDKNSREIMIEYQPENGGKKQKRWDHKWVWTGGSTDWKEYVIPEFTAPADAKYGRIRIGKTGGAAGSVWYADLRMEECPQADAFENRVAVIPFGKSHNDSVIINDFIVPVTRVKSNHATDIKAYFDNEAVYFKVTAHQKSIGGEQFMDTVKKNNSDAIELFLLPPGESKQYHMLVYPSGKRIGLYEEWTDKVWPMKRVDWDLSKVSTKVEIFEDEWVIDVRIPFSAMKCKAAPADGEVWRMSFCREVATRGKELSSWANLPGAQFQRTESFGKIIFRRSGLVADSPKLTVKAVTSKVRNLSDKPRTVTINRVEHTKKGAFVISTVDVAVPAKGTVDAALNAGAESKELLWCEVRDGKEVIAKHCALPTSTYFSLAFSDPEGVRTQTVYLAVDMPFFISWHMRHNLPFNVNRGLVRRDKAAVDFVMELPEEVKVRGLMHDASAYHMRQSPLVKPVTKKVVVNGKNYLQHRFALPIIANWAEPQFLIYYDCQGMKPGMEFTGKTWFIYKDQIVSEAVKEYKTINVGKVRKPFKNLPFNIGLMDAVTLYNWFPEDTLSRYLDLGFNCLSVPVERIESKEFYTGNDPKTREQYCDIMYRDFKKEKRSFFMNTVSVTTGAHQHVWTRRDEPGTVGIRKDGTKCTAGGYSGSPGLCFNYRGPLHQKWVNRLANSSAFGKYRLTWLALDMEVWRPPAWDELCYCQRCLKLFKEFCIKNGRSDLAKLDPRTATGEDFKKMWKKFQVESAAGFVTAAIDAVREKVKGAKPTSPRGKFVVQDYGGYPGLQYSADDLDYFEQSMYFTPDGNYQKLKRLRETVFSNDNKTLGTGLSYGQTGGCPDWHMTAENAKESLFEVMVFGSSNVVYYYAHFIEPLRMSYIVKALNAVTPCEDIILDGKLANDVKASEKDMLLTHRVFGNEGLLAVRAYYSPKDLTGTITFDKINVPVNVYDAETGEIVGKLTPQKPSFTYSIAKKRCKLLYIGTQAQFDKRYK